MYVDQKEEKVIYKMKSKSQHKFVLLIVPFLRKVEKKLSLSLPE